MILPIILWDDPVLKIVADEVPSTEFGPDIERIGMDMIETVKASANGVGLSGPQVGISKRIFVMAQSSLTKKDDWSYLILVNPVIALSSPSWHGGSTAYGLEGCLSFPGLYEQVERSNSVTMTYQKPDGEFVHINMAGWDARIVQHEVDHLDGIMFFDRISRQMRKRLMQTWEKKKR